jgi:hypothetical protein
MHIRGMMSTPYFSVCKPLWGVSDGSGMVTHYSAGNAIQRNPGLAIAIAGLIC